jgi:hypothetical protein
MRLQLVNRLDCGLCEDLGRELDRLSLPYESLDVDKDDALLSLYDETVPVLLLDGREIARAPVSRNALRSLLSRAGVLR